MKTTSLLILFLLLNGCFNFLPAQNTVPGDSTDYVYFKRGVGVDSTYKNYASGELTPGKGFDIVRTRKGSLNLSIYAIGRYLNQFPGETTFKDHLGREREFVGRNDFYWHRSMVWLSGFVLDPRVTYTATVWTVMTTQQTLLYGNIQYKLNKYFKFGIGIAPNLSVRSMQGPFPLYYSTDRTMGEESLRGGFTNGFFVTGEIVPRLHYTGMLGNNLSILGINASKLTRDLSKSFTLMWMPTTGEFGPRGGLGDFESHKKLSTRFGTSICSSREDRFNNIGQPSPDNTQVRMTDGVLFFETGALADGVTVQKANYNMIAVDLGFKYRGFCLFTEWYGRRLNNFLADAPVPINEIIDLGYSIQTSFMIVPKTVDLYAIHSYFHDEFKRFPWEAGGGVNIYPFHSRSWRINLQAVHVYKSSAGGTFGLYTAGHTGTMITFGTDILL